MATNFIRVGEFHEKFGLPVTGKVPIGLIDKEAFEFRKKFLHEELEEFERSHVDGDLPGIADALADLIYVAYGTAHFYGIPLDEVIREVHRKNMMKERSSGDGDGRSKRGSGLDVVKPEGWTPPDVGAILRRWSESDGCGFEDSDKWTRRFMDLAKVVAQWSKDPTTKVGTVLVGVDRKNIAVGYNGFPPGIEDSRARLNNRELKHRLTQHAERNVLDNSTFETRFAWLYCTQIPCSECTKSIISRGIVRVVCPPVPNREPWLSDSKISKAMMSEAGVDLAEVYYA